MNETLITLDNLTIGYNNEAVLCGISLSVARGATHAVMEYLSEIRKERNIAVLLVTHDFAAVRRYAGHVVWLTEGDVFVGCPHELLDPEAIKELLLVSFDRELAIILGKNVVFWDMLLYWLIGLTVSMAVLSVGPLTAFGFLLIPALIAHLFAANMRQFAVFACLSGGAVAFIGFWIAYQYDFPVGPTDVVVLGVLYAIAWIVARLL
ncbi:MAG: metal ABC transporter permease [Nitrospirae bacterium]|nr:metal ABC transporter permease [Nitrospirota bacterium]